MKIPLSTPENTCIICAEIELMTVKPLQTFSLRLSFRTAFTTENILYFRVQGLTAVF